MLGNKNEMTKYKNTFMVTFVTINNTFVYKLIFIYCIKKVNF